MRTPLEAELMRSRGSPKTMRPATDSLAEVNSLASMAIRHLLLVCVIAGISIFAPSPCYAQSEGASSPLGPYTSWSEADRKFETTLRSRCANTTTADGSSRLERAREEAWKALWAACVLNGMPKDWPAREVFEAEIQERIAAAKRADPAISDSVFAEAAKRAGETKQANSGTSRPTRSIPSAPYASWSDAEKKSVEESVTWRCIALATMIYAAPMKSEEAKQEGMAAFMLACVANEMPSDWPSRDLFRSEAAKHAIAARRADPTIPDGLLSGSLMPKR